MSFRLVTFSESPSYLRYLVPETGQLVPPSYLSVHNYYDLRDAVICHYKANGKAVPGDLDSKIQDHLCHKIPGRFCEDEHGRRLTVFSGAFDIGAVIQGTRVLANWFMSGRERVSNDEVDRRTGICVNCPHNKQPEGCTSCNMPALTDLVNSIVGGQDRPGDSNLRGCEICMCSLRAKTRIPLQILRKNTSEDQLKKFPSYCWMVL